MEILTGDNLQTLETLAAKGQRFDLIELDGPYMAGLEAGWDDLTEAGYIEHYAQRLALVRQLLQPWGAVFVFGYPEGCAEIKSWAHRTGTLYLRRWLHWYKAQTQHKGRKVETILFFIRGEGNRENLAEFGKMLKQERERRGMTLRQVAETAWNMGHRTCVWWHRGGNLYFETGSGSAPNGEDLAVLSKIFGFNPDEWAHVLQGSYEGLTEIDYISRTYPEDTAALNDNGLRSKPIGLYMDLFSPVKPVSNPHPQALILYGGSGNAAIAAEALGYEATVCEISPIRAEAIKKRAAKLLPKWTARVQARAATRPLFSMTQEALW